VKVLTSKVAKRVLVIDDDPVLLDCVTGWLSLQGHIVQAVDNRDEGLKVAISAYFDVVLLDYRMPGMSAMDFIEQIRKKDIRFHVILMTADHGAFELASVLGIGQVLPKPFDIELVTWMVDRVEKPDGSCTAQIIVQKRW